MRERSFALIVLLVTAITYLGALQFEFVFDDYGQIVFNPFVKAWRYAPDYFVSSVWKHLAPLSPGNYYRPLFLLLLRLNFSVFGNRPLGWHVAAIALHLLVTWLVFAVVRKMTGEFTLAWLSALIFGVHPIHHEVVAWISGMTESLFAAMFLASFLAYLLSRESSKRTWMPVSYVFYALALLSKETAIVLPAMVFAHGWIDRSSDGAPRVIDRFKNALIPAIGYLPVAIIYVFVRRWVLSGISHSVSGASIFTWLLTLPSLLLFYVQHWFFPIHLAESYDVLYQTRLSPLHVILPAAIILAVGGAIWAVRGRLSARAVAYAAAWIVIPLLPALDTFIFRPDELVHDRYFYVPSIGAALLVALVIERVAKSKAGVFGQPLRVVAIALALTIVLGFLSARAASFWINDYALFSRAHQISPLNATAASSLGAEMLARGKLDAAGTLLEESYRLHPDDYRIAYNLGRVEYARHQFPQAAEYTRQAIVLSPNFSDAYISMGAIELKLGQRAEAQTSFRRAVETSPYSAPAHTTYGIVLALGGDCVAATEQFKTALILNPGDAVTQAQMFRCRAASSTPAPTKPGQL